MLEFRQSRQLLKSFCKGMITGKKETITRFKVKKQKKFLNDDMKHLHAKFLSGNGDIIFPLLSVSTLLGCKGHRKGPTDLPLY